MFSTIFQAEVSFLGNLLHKNLVKLVGYCIEDDQRLLVYEFMPRGSLENHLFRSMKAIAQNLPYLSLIQFAFQIFTVEKLGYITIMFYVHKTNNYLCLHT